VGTSARVLVAVKTVRWVIVAGANNSLQLQFQKVDEQLQDIRFKISCAEDNNFELFQIIFKSTNLI